MADISNRAILPAEIEKMLLAIFSTPVICLISIKWKA